MQTFGLTLQISLTAVVPKPFLEEARKEAQAEDAPLFLKTMQEKFPEDDDQFMLAIVKNAFRTNTRVGALTFMGRSGIGGSVSPVQIISESITQPKNAVAVFAEATDPDNAKEVPQSKAQQLRIERDAEGAAEYPSAGALVQGLVDDRTARSLNEFPTHPNKDAE